MRRLRAWAILGSLSLVATLTAIPGASVAGAVDSYWCSEDPSPPCITSATRNGAAVGPADPNWGLQVLASSFGGGTEFLWNVTSKTNDDLYELGADSLDDTWFIRFDTGSVVPRVSFAHGTKQVAARSADGDGTYHINVTSRPIIINGECDQSVWPWTCDETATTERIGYLGGDITDYGTWEDVAQRQAMNGMNFSTNVAATSLPPEIEYDGTTDTNYLLIRLASPHFREDGSTLVRGNAHVRIPNAFLREAYGIDAPATMTGSGLVPTVSGSSTGSGTISVTQESGDDAMVVDITDMTFSARVLRIKRGTITPTRPTDLRATRVTAYRGRVGFDPSRPRGSRITGYRARCVARQGSDVAVATADSSPIVVRSLTPGVGYDCRVRALSRAGASLWSSAVLLRARPA